ncbi:MAG: hypothetical protein MUF00_15415 [Gemmatimonadaceae bacterium]|jgi:hypothetical protein|nr:hypothetical protein [Gemmatimonadaceae bacterium]
MISQAGFEALLCGKRAKTLEYVAGVPCDWYLAVEEKRYLVAARIAGPLDKLVDAMGRVEQAYLRRLHVRADAKGCGSCALCGVKVPTELLVAAHIKQRSSCTSRQRRDAEHVAFAVCVFGCDALYERGWITVDEGGAVRVSSMLRSTAALRKAADKYKKRLCSAHNVHSEPYFEWHRLHRFIG